MNQRERPPPQQPCLKRLSSLKRRNLNVLGATSFTAVVPREGLRALCDPDAAS
ncbi:hypothetical protein OG756_06115 [Streptomyces sp. NBC_01310]|uniref:hypothetical protein n=1 Tax=unclassified Streptomyces TaxID=2593676 RepID=UPI0035B5A5C4|nr:hypothetical protein OG756_06115 [Streptomyces sp. NBC_01310]